MAEFCKMSKSRGNVVLPEEVVHGVCELAHGMEFRDIAGQVVDWRHNIWRDADGYRTATRHGRQPVFLHQIGNPVPCLLRFLGGREQVQHSQERGFWERLLALYE